MSRRVIILCVAALLMLSATPIAARRGELTPHQPGTIAGVIRTGIPAVHLDVTSSWLLAQPMQYAIVYERVAPAQVVGFQADALAPWLMGSVPTDPLCLRGERFSGMVDLGNPRMHGLLDTSWSVDIFNEVGGANSLFTVDFHLATPIGHWAGTLTGYGAGMDGPAHLHGLVLGDGDFSGDTAALELTRSAAGAWDVTGTLY